MDNNRKTGSSYEKLAAEYLQAQGYQILEMNYRCRIGEIDIIAKDDTYLVFIEVKYRRDISCGMPQEAVDRKKQRIISKVADYYRMMHGCTEVTPCRFDVVAICGQKVQLIQNAFDYMGW
jgi:putative endonuclease